MSHKPIHINTISLRYPDKTCFENFSTIIYPGKKILIMGMNGAGKSSLLKIIQGLIEPTEGSISLPKDIRFGYVPQTVTDYPELSGGQRFNKSLSQAINAHPDILCFDEPTNHLDIKNKQSLIKMLNRLTPTLFVISHDIDVLQLSFDEIWHLEHEQVKVFKGNYADYLEEYERMHDTLERNREEAEKEKRKVRKLIQQEKIRVAHSHAANKKENDKNLAGAMRERASDTANKNAKRLSKMEDKAHQKMADNFQHKKLEPKFKLDAHKVHAGKSIVFIRDGSCGYNAMILHDINLHLQGGQRIAITGPNGSGKSTFFKALLQDPAVKKNGEWRMPESNDIGYLDQHYSTLDPDQSPTETIKDAAPSWNNLEIRKHLNDFLFITPEEVTKKIAYLSGGEKARLCLALIAAQNPSLLLLDEITNNIDLETRAHILDVLAGYPGALIMITHDMEFLKALEVASIHEVNDERLQVKHLDNEDL